MKLSVEPRHLKMIDDILVKYDYSFFAFGSRVLGNNKRFSDLDIFFFEEIPNRDLLSLEEAFEESDLPFIVDLVHFKKCDPAFQEILLKNYLCLRPSSQLRALEKNHLDHAVYLPQKLGFDVHCINGITGVQCGQNHLFNGVYGAPQDVFDIYAMKKSYRDEPFVWWVPPSAYHPGMRQIFIENDFTFESIRHVMVHQLNDVSGLEPKTDLVIRQVLNRQMLQDFISIFKVYGFAVSDFYGRMDDDLLLGKEQLFVGYVADQACSIAVLFTSGEMAGIFSFLPGSRSEHAWDIMVFLMNRAKDQGFQSIALWVSNEWDHRITHQLGFSKAGEFVCFQSVGVLP